MRGIEHRQTWQNHTEEEMVTSGLNVEIYFKNKCYLFFFIFLRISNIRGTL
jgi:hypothetical protein